MNNMVFRLYVFLISACFSSGAGAQDWEKKSNYFDLTLGVGDAQSSSLGYQHNWKMNIAWNPPKRRILEVGIGLRFTSFFGVDQYFVTTPAIVKNPILDATPPWVQDPDPTRLDSVFISSTQINALNFTFHMAFFFTERLKVGIHTDIIGISFGGSKSGTYINGLQTQPVIVSPASFNYLFAGQQGYDESGSFFGEFYVAYSFGDKWSAKIGLNQTNILEYVTDKKVQLFPEPNDRFRITTHALSIGAIYKIPLVEKIPKRKVPRHYS